MSELPGNFSGHSDIHQSSTGKSDFLRSLLNPQRLTEIIDIGANPVDGDPPYSSMLRTGLCRVTGFEPQVDALHQLNAHKGPNETYLPYVVGDGGSHVLKIFNYSGLASLLEPDPDNLGLFDFFGKTARVVARLPVETRKLDEINEVDRFDFLKIDIQGGELGVFESARSKLQHAVAVQTEVSFIALYKDQPTVGNIDIELRSQGFIPHSFADLKKWQLSPCVVNNQRNGGLKQLLEADIIYVRDHSDPNSMSDEQLKQLALLAHHIFGSYDLALRCVAFLEQRNAIASGSSRDYLRSVNHPDLKHVNDWLAAGNTF